MNRRSLSKHIAWLSGFQPLLGLSNGSFSSSRKIVCSTGGDETEKPQAASKFDGNDRPFSGANDLDRLARLAAKVTVALSAGGRGVENLEDEALRAYCEAKGAQVRSDGLAAAAKRYALEEEASRKRAGPVWDVYRPNARQRLLHDVCNGEGDATYTDPDTGFTVFAAVAHLRRGYCCGLMEDGERIHRCRHCPYSMSGEVVNPSMKRLAARIPLIDAVRREVTAQVESITQLSTEPQVTTGASCSSTDSHLTVNSTSNDDAGIGYTFDVDENSKCTTCEGTSVTFCTRCKGFRFLITPEARLCPQCKAKGIHPCMDCTPWRPPQRTHFMS